MKKTVRDVAERVGFSAPAVYQALRGTGRLSSETRRKILDAASELGVRPNRTAANMKRGRHLAYGLLLHSWQTFPKHYLFALLNESRRRGMFLLIEYALPNEPPRMLEEDCVDAVLLFETETTPFLEELRRLAIPAIHVNANTRFEPNCITYDERAAIRLGLAHLAERGFRKTALLMGRGATPDKPVHYSSVDRESELKAVAKERGEAGHVLRLEHGRNHTLTARQLGALLERDPAVDSFILYSDSMVHSAYAAFRELKREPGVDVGVIGFNNSWRATDAFPALTALGVPADVLATEAMDALEVAIKHGETPGRTLSYRLFERQSTPGRAGRTVADRS